MPDTILPADLPRALDRARRVRLLSLDCFDTLLWRDTHAPADLFALLDGITPAQRIRGEVAARKARLLAGHPTGEVTLREIYAAMLPAVDATVRDAYVAYELAVEAAHCHAFAPTVALIRAAKARGIRVVVVSDTYLEHDQLAALIRTAAGDAVADMIDAIVCSSEHRRSKGEGLFSDMLARMRVPADRVLHIGDNPRADLIAAKRHGLCALHLVQFADTTVQRLRLEAAAGAMLFAGGTAFQPHRAALAIGEPAIADPAEAFGFATLGPVLAPFARWLADEAQGLAAMRGARVHPLFLMRDGFLPARVLAEIAPGHPSTDVEISRFAAIAASLTDAAAVDRFVAREIGEGSGATFLRQLLLTDEEAAALLAETEAAADPVLALADAVRAPAQVARIVARGRAYADRLVAYLRTRIDPAPGDTLMLVDLGYNGTVQTHVAALLEARFGVSVAGRYLILSEDLPGTLDKRGMLDARALDPPALAALLGSVAVVEQLCTVSQGSVVDYADAAPVRAAAGIKGAQSAIRDRIQRGCLAFARSVGAATVRAADPRRDETARRGAAAALARFLFLPLPAELAQIATFAHDANLGTDDTVALFDADAATRGLRERGLFYMKGAKRMFLPAELRGQGLPTSLALLAQRRFALDLSYADFCDASIALPVLVADGATAFADTVAATPTHDGYHVAAIPVADGRYTVGLQFGQLYDWVQIESARFVPVAAFCAGDVVTDRLARPALPSCEGLVQVAPHLFRCDGAEAFLMVPPPAPDPAMAGVPMMLTVVFRPIAAREPALASAPAPAALSELTA